MRRDNRSEQKATPLLSFLVIAAIALFSAVDTLPDEVIGVVAVLLILAIPVGIGIVIARAVRKANQKTPAHTHDRIDHRSDLKINPKTGKTEGRPVQNVPTHSPEEHWKQQLDGLLANGTIDRAEYRALLKHRF